MQYSKSLRTAIIISLLLATAPTYAADTEYDAIGINVFDAINAQAAYDQGYTGAGINVGVCDIPTNFAHPDLNGKQFDSIDMAGWDWSDLWHGTHVSGIVAASKNGVGMHGVAYDAYVIAGSPMTEILPDGNFEVKDDIFATFLDRPEVKVINNSWGLSTHITEIDFETEEELRNDQYVRFTYNNTVKTSNADKLLVFSAGNRGPITANMESNLDYLYKDNKGLSTNLLTVTAANGKDFVRNKDGGFDVTSLCTAVFSNLAMFNEDSSLTAPGLNITSTAADFATAETEYISDNGTSMAAPMVTGVGALVQQGFPYLGGKQIGDVLLSTANNKINNTDGFYLVSQEDFIADEDGDITKKAYDKYFLYWGK